MPVQNCGRCGMLYACMLLVKKISTGRNTGVRKVDALCRACHDGIPLWHILLVRPDDAQGAPEMSCRVLARALANARQLFKRFCCNVPCGVPSAIHCLCGGCCLPPRHCAIYKALRARERARAFYEKSILEKACGSRRARLPFCREPRCSMASHRVNARECHCDDGGGRFLK